ncbi:hypothetical protein V8C34DRAFT_324800 [Trichoderma compactum]
METITRILLGLVLMRFANALSGSAVERSSLTPPTPSWRGSAVLSFDADYETPTPSPDEYSSPDPYSFQETWYTPPSTIEPSTTPRPQYSAIVTIRTTTWVLSRSTTITSVILETYYSTLTDVENSNEGGTVSDPSSSAPCAAASGNPSGYGYKCSSSSSSTSSSVRAMTTITWSPEVTAYPPPSISTQGRASPASTSTTTSSSASTTAAATDEGTETPPVVTGAAPPPQKADTRAIGAVVALLAILA